MRLTPLEWGLRAPITPRLGGNWEATAPQQIGANRTKNKPTLNTKLRILPMAPHRVDVGDQRSSSLCRSHILMVR